MNLRRTSLICALLVLAAPYSIQAKKDSRMKEVGIGLAIFGGVALAVGGAISAVSSFFETSNATLIAQGIDSINKFKAKYRPVATKMVAYFGISRLADVAYNWQERVDESLLYELARDMHKQEISWHTFSSNTESFLYTVKRQIGTMQKRVNKMSAKNRLDHAERQELEELNQVHGELIWVEKEVRAMHNYLCVDHAAYFCMALQEWALCKKYVHEIALLDGSLYTTLHLDQAINGLIGQNNRHARYAYMKYYTDLVDDLDKLCSFRAGIVHGCYPDRCAWTDRVIATLNHLVHIVEPWYRYERGLYEAEEVERRRIELEREKIRLLREQNEAIRAHNSELERQRLDRDIATTADFFGRMINGPKKHSDVDVQVSVEIVS